MKLDTKFLNRLKVLSNDWATQPLKNRQEMCDGLVFSILAEIDGEGDSLPPLSLASVDDQIDIAGELHNKWAKLISKK